MKKKIFLIILALLVISIYKITNQSIIIPDLSIRLRVIPNSNNPEDISIKEQVKKYLEADIYKLTKETKTIEEARIIIENNIPTIESNIDHIFVNNNYHIPYKVDFGYNYFPQKEYEGKIYDEGYYESLVISIGEASGDNWWCVLFPNFCLIDKDNNQKHKFLIKELLDKYSKK